MQKELIEILILVLTTFGNSLIISPDGKILKSLNKKEGVITASIDPNLPIKLRSIIPSLKED